MPNTQLDAITSPPVSKEFMEMLEKAFPLKAPRKEDDIESLMWLGGQQEVINYIKHKVGIKG